MPDTPDDIDLHVGRRLRERRRARGVSQEALADAIGVTFQQVQKYERGANRIAPSRLLRAARFLKVSVASFYPDEAADAPLAGPGPLARLAFVTGGIELAAAFPLLDPEQRRAIVRLVASMLPEAEAETEVGTGPAVAATAAFHQAARTAAADAFEAQRTQRLVGH